VRLLLDTHVFLWAVSDPDRLKAEARAAIEDGTNEIFVSVVTAWEIALKQSLGKLDLPDGAERWMPQVLSRAGFEILELGLKSALRVRALPWLHRDPFDRFLVAHGIEEGLTLVTRDEVLALYGIARMDA
jgi:PIN domain nuclease of toxin-antitoxin system